MAMDKNINQLLQLLLKWYKLSRVKEFNAVCSKDAAWNSIMRKIERKPVRILNFRIFAAAIFIGMIISAAALWQYSIYTEKQEVLVKVGKSKAILFIDGGQKYDLEKFRGDINYNNVKLAVNANQQLIYNAKELDSTYYNEIDVPRGGEYRILLADSSSVMMNSLSRLRFPVAFSKNEKKREVTLYSGEAFFEVAKDKNKPFIVITPHCMVEVLGTKFNVSISEHKTCITLAEGSVCVKRGDKSGIMEPGEQMVVSENFISSRGVEVSQYIGWTNGVFEYSDTPLEEIVGQLSLWYDVDFRFNSKDLESKRFAGVILRKQSLKEALDILEKVSKVNFEIKNDYILVRK